MGPAVVLVPGMSCGTTLLTSEAISACVVRGGANQPEITLGF